MLHPPLSGPCPMMVRGTCCVPSLPHLVQLRNRLNGLLSPATRPPQAALHGVTDFKKYRRFGNWHWHLPAPWTLQSGVLDIRWWCRQAARNLCYIFFLSLHGYHGLVIFWSRSAQTANRIGAASNHVIAINNISICTPGVFRLSTQRIKQ